MRTGRRSFLELGLATGVVAGCAPHANVVTPPKIDAQVVRVASVTTAVEGEVLPALAETYRAATGVTVAVTAVEDPYELARAGKADLVISHYGHHSAEAFVLEGLGGWPHTIFSNQLALVGPPSDPAGVRGLRDLGDAFKRIAATKSPFVLIDTDGAHYLTEILWNAAGQPDRAGWFFDAQPDEPGGHGKVGLLRATAERKGYTFCGLTPFTRAKTKHAIELEPLVLDDPLLQRLMVAIVVRDDRVPGVNAAGARNLQAHLLTPASQALIRTVIYPGAVHVGWIPGGRHNRTADLPARSK